MVVRRDVYERLGGFDTRIRRYGEDWEMWVRVAAHYPVWYEPEPLAIYRVGDGSLTSEAMRTGENVRDLVRVIELIQPLLPEHVAGELRRRALETAALTALAGHAARSARPMRSSGRRSKPHCASAARRRSRRAPLTRPLAGCCTSSRVGLRAAERRENCAALLRATRTMARMEPRC
jgi:hypothetical protein